MRHLMLTVCERELIGLVQGVRHWRPDHYALKFMLDQRLSTVPQHQWVSKLFGYDFAVEYRSGHLNTVADALSHHEDDDVHLQALTVPVFHLFDMLRHELQEDVALRELRNSVVAERGEPWHVVDGLILRGSYVSGHVDDPA